ncbi:MAG: CRISPR-associated endonuclease Cas2 [Proteobacteria bacterium]|nr:CRISPR-associated endonuclease Cas2 [Pseudomonadota bacterium]
MDDILLEQMKTRLSREVNEEDSVRIYALCAKCTKAAMVLGRGEISKENENPFIL